MTIDPEFSDWRNASEHTIELSPIRKFNWKTGGARDYWEPKIGRFRQEVVLPYTAEILGDDDHPQNAAVVRVSEDMVMEIATEFGSKGLAFSQLSIHGDDHGSIFWSYPNLLDIGGNNKQNFIVAQDEEMMKEVAKIITSENMTREKYEKAAEAFGWPDCCTEFHADRVLADKDFDDPIYEIACNTPSAKPHEDDPEQALVHFPDPMLNIAWRYNGWRFIQHMPCSFECEHSGEIARRNYDAMVERGYGEQAEYLLEWLDLPFTWSGYHGLVNIRNAYGIGSYTTNDYWSEKQLIWHRPHSKKPDFEPNHNTTALEPLDPEASQI